MEDRRWVELLELVEGLIMVDGLMEGCLSEGESMGWW